MRPVRPTRWLALALLVALLLGVGWVLSGAWAGPSDDPTVALRCLGVRCGGEVLACVRDPECKAWLDCMQGCGADKMRCPTFCGAFFQSKRVSAFTQCGLAQWATIASPSARSDGRPMAATA